MQSAAITELTEKQREALTLVGQHLSSKEIARKLNVSPRSVDQRLDAARRTLGASSRFEAARLLIDAQGSIPQRLTSEPITVPESTSSVPSDPYQLGTEKTLNDSFDFIERSPWSSISSGQVSEVKPEQLSSSVRLMAIVVGMVLISLTAGAVAGLYLLVESAISQ